GRGNDSYSLTSGGTTTIRPGSQPGAELIILPGGASLGSFTSFASGGDLVLRSLDGATTATIKDYFAPSANKIWFLLGDGNSPVLLQDWAAGLPTDPSDYVSRIAALRANYTQQLPAELTEAGNGGHTLGTLSDIPLLRRGPIPVSSYSFGGVTQQALSVTDGV